MNVRKRVLYSGHVQGVGFRYTAERLAQHYPVAGHVRNLPDGDVELAVEGPGAHVDAFLAAVGSQMAGYIHSTTVSEEAPTGQTGFHIRR